MSEMEQQPICKIALGIEYDGSKYYGWQRQNEVYRRIFTPGSAPRRAAIATSSKIIACVRRC